MKFLIYISMTLLMSCQTTSSNESEQINTYNDKGVEIETELEKPVINDTIWVNYEFKDGEDLQKLSVFWISKDSIVFKLVTDVMVCLRNENGIATIKMDSEVDDQDQNEMKLNYQVTHDSKINLIRISDPAGDKAWVLNDSINPNECDPIEEPMNIKK